MIWVEKHTNTNPTAGWVGWSQEMLRPTLLPRFRERKEELTSLRYKFRDISIPSMVPLFVPNSSPSIESPFYSRLLILHRRPMLQFLREDSLRAILIGELFFQIFDFSSRNFSIFHIFLFFIGSSGFIVDRVGIPSVWSWSGGDAARLWGQWCLLSVGMLTRRMWSWENPVSMFFKGAFLN